MATMRATVLQRRPVHRRGFLSGHWLAPPADAGEAEPPDNAPAILIQIRPERVAEIAVQLEELGIGTIVPGEAPSRCVIALAGGMTVADALSSVADIPGVLAASLSGPSLSGGGA